MREAERCEWCCHKIGVARLTVPRALTADLVFCSWRCHDKWRSYRAAPGWKQTLAPVEDNRD